MSRPLLRLFAVVCLAALHAAQAFAGDSASAAGFFEDGLARFNREDMPGAIIQLKNALQQDKRMLAAHVLLARALTRSGQYAAAEVAFREALGLGVDISEVAVPYGNLLMLLGRPEELLERLPDGEGARVAGPEILSLRALALADLGRLEQSLALLVRAQSQDPRAHHVWRAQAAIMLTAGRVDEARTAAARAVELAPDDPGALTIRAAVANSSGRYADALSDYGRALAIEPARGDALVGRAGILVDLGIDEEAARDLEMFRGRVGEDPRASYLRSLLAERRGDAAEARVALESVQRQIAALPPAWLARREEFLLLAALANRALGSTEVAKGQLDLLVRRFPHNIGARKLLATMQLDAGDTAPALATLAPVLRAAPDDPNALYLAGRAQLARGQHSKAMELLEKAAAADASPRILRALGESRIGKGDWQQGIEDLEQSFRRRPSDEGAGFMLATMQMRHGNRDRALAVARQLVEGKPGSVAARNLLGALKAAAGDPDGARAEYQEALRLAPDFLAPRLNLVRLDIEQGKFDHARALLAPALTGEPKDPAALFELGRIADREGRAEEALEALGKSLDRDPGNPRVAQALADLYVRLRRPGEARDVLQSLAIRRPGDLDVLELLARAQLAAGDRGAALQVYQDMTKLAEFDPGLQVRIGWLNFGAGDLAAAKYNLRKALADVAKYPPAIELEGTVALAERDFSGAESAAGRLRATPDGARLGLALEVRLALAKGRPGAAVPLARELVRADPGSPSVVLLAETLQQAGDWPAAKVELQAWLQREPGDVQGRLSFATLAMQQQDWALAGRQYDALRASLPGHPGVLNNLALALAHDGKVDQALPIAREANGVAPTDPVVADTLGWILVLNGDPQAGLRHLRDARLKIPTNAEVRWHLGFTLDRLGRHQEAVGELEEALRGEAAFVGVEEARQLLIRLRAKLRG